MGFQISTTVTLPDAPNLHWNVETPDFSTLSFALVRETSRSFQHSFVRTILNQGRCCSQLVHRVIRGLPDLTIAYSLFSYLRRPNHVIVALLTQFQWEGRTSDRD